MANRLFVFLAMAVLAGLCSARHFEVLKEGTETPCIMLDVSFNVEVVAMKGDEVVAVINLTPDDKGVKVIGECSENKIEIGVSFGENTMWAIAFQEQEIHPVAMFRVMQFVPKVLFGSAVDISEQVQYTDSRPIYLTDKAHSYKCPSQDIFKYEPVTPVKDYNFTVTATINDIQTQGLGLKDSEYGTPEVCKHPIPGPPTTTHAPAPLTGHFEVLKEGTKTPCIMLDAKFNIEILAFENDEQVAARTLSQDTKDIKVKGQCDENLHEIGIYFTENSMWSMTYVQDDTHPVSMYRGMEFVPKEIFEPPVDVSKSMLFTDNRIVYLKDKTHSYKCPSEDVTEYVGFIHIGSKYSYKVSVTVYTIHTQGFGLTGREYGEAEVCKHPIPVPTTTPHAPVTIVGPTQIPVPGPKAPVNNYIVKEDDVTCIAMETTLTIVIKYPVSTSKKYKTATINVPEDAKAKGTCKGPDGKQTLKIMFLNGWELTFTFSKDKKTEEPFPLNYFKAKTIEPSYRISNITLLVVVHKKIFPDSVLGEGAEYLEVPSSKTPDFPKKSADRDYYRCNSRTTNVLKKGVEVKTTHLKFKAFNSEPEAGFDGKAHVCGSDHTSGKSKAGLIVGLVIAAIVAVVAAILVVMFIQRRRRDSYNNIQ